MTDECIYALTDKGMRKASEQFCKSFNEYVEGSTSLRIVPYLELSQKDFSLLRFEIIVGTVPKDKFLTQEIRPAYSVNKFRLVKEIKNIFKVLSFGFTLDDNTSIGINNDSSVLWMKIKPGNTDWKMYFRKVKAVEDK